MDQIIVLLFPNLVRYLDGVRHNYFSFFLRFNNIKIVTYFSGKNTRGQLGLNDSENKIYPTQLRTLRNSRVRYIACGEEFSAFLTLDGGVFTCGAGMFGQLGHGSNCNEILPRQVCIRCTLVYADYHG